MSNEETFDSDSTDGPVVDQDEVFEEFSELDTDAFIDAQFEGLYEKEREMFPEHGDEINYGSVQLQSQLDAARSFVFTNPILKDSPMFAVDSKIPASRELLCSECFKTLSEWNIELRSSINNQEETHTSGEPDEEHFDRRKLIVTEEQLSDICDDVGTCWRQLGPKLQVKASKIRNIDEEYKHNCDKANALLIMWKEQEGSNATVGCLCNALESIGRKSISEKLLGVMNVELPACEPPSKEHLVNLSVRCDLDVGLENKIMLCEDNSGKKYILKEISSDGGQWDLEEIQKSKTFLESVAVAARDMEKTVEQRRQESLKRISSEVHELREKLKRVKLDCKVEYEVDICTSVAKDEQPSSTAEVAEDSEGSQDEPESLLKSCESQQQSWQAMYIALVKLVGEAGQPKEDNYKCLKQLFDFTKELHGQEKKFFSRIEHLQEQEQQLDESQCSRLEGLKKWQRAHNQQLDGLEKLLSSLLEPGRVNKANKLMKRRSEPVLSKKLQSSGGFGRRRAKTDSSKTSRKSSSLSELSVPNKKDKISEPLCARRMYLMDTSKGLNN